MKKQLLILFALITYSAFAQIPSNPVREYLFSNNLNDTSHSSSNLNVSAGSGYSFVNDRTNTVSSALSPSNTGFYGGFLTANNANPINNIGVSFWLKFEQSNSGLEPIIRLLDGTNGNNILVRRISSNTIEYRLLVGNSTTVGVIQNQALLSTTDYNHIYIDIRSTPNEKNVDAYFNGSLDTSTTNVTSNNLFASNTFINIARTTSSSPALNTSLDDIRIYDRSLTTSEIQQLANEGVNSCSNFVNIPDANFKAILVADSNINTDGDTEICTTEAQAYTGPIGVSFSNISDLTGIEAFTNITALECQDNQITTLDVSNNTQLTRLYCYNNALTTLTIGQNTIINRIECGSNQLTSLDVSQCPSLLLLTCASNQLTSLNVANGNNGNIFTLEANGNPNLTCIQHDVGFTPPTHDGITGWLKDATATWSSNCAASSCTTFVNIPDANFKAILVANSVINTDGDTEICTTEAQAYTGAIFVVMQGISDLTGIEAFINITELYCDENFLTTLDISSNIALTNLTCGLNQLTSLDVSNNTLLTEIDCGGNQITSLDISANLALTNLLCSSNQITSLDVSSNTNLERLNCSGNQLTSLNVANTNNGNMSLMSAITNTNLTCIQHDNGFDPTTNPSWQKDASSSWSDNCASLSVADVAFNNTITIYPNPASALLNITSNSNAIKSIEIYNILGEKVIDTKSQSVDISSLTNGIYIAKIKSDDNRLAVKKFIKQ